MPFPLSKEGNTRPGYGATTLNRELGTPEQYRSIDWYLRRLEEAALQGLASDKLPAVVSAYRTMMEAVGLIGPATSIQDNRTQVLALPDGLTTEQLIAIATGAVMESADRPHSIRDIVRSSEEGDQDEG